MNSSESLRSKLSRRQYSKDQGTHIIVLDENVKESQIGDTASNYILKKENYKKLKPWNDKYSIDLENSSNVISFYKEILKEVYIRVENNDEVNIEKILKIILQDYGSNFKNSYSKETLPRHIRKQIFKRAINLFNDLEPFFKLVSYNDVKRVVVTKKNSVRLHKLNDKIETIPLFICNEESKLLLALLSKRVKDNGLKKDYIFQFNNIPGIILEEISDYEEDRCFVFKKTPKPGVSILDLIRKNMLSPALSRSLSHILREKAGGILITGTKSSGKTNLLAALVSTLSLQRVPLLVTCNREIKNAHSHIHYLNYRTVEEAFEKNKLGMLAEKVVAAGISDVFIDDANEILFMFMKELVDRFDIHPVLNFTGKSASSVFKKLANELKISHNDIASYLPVVALLSGNYTNPSIEQVLESKIDNESVVFQPIVQRSEDDTSGWIIKAGGSSREKYFNTITIKNIG